MSIQFQEYEICVVKDKFTSKDISLEVTDLVEVLKKESDK